MEDFKDNVKEKFENIKESTQNISSNIKETAENITGNIKENIDSIKPETKNGNFNLNADFLNSNTLIAKASFLLLIIIIFSFLFYILSKLILYLLSLSETPYLLYGMKDATVPLSVPQAMSNKKAIPILRSRNEYDGIEFTYAFWMYVNEVDYDEVDYKHVFHKGSLSEGSPAGLYGPNNCPGVYLYNGKKHFSDDLIDKYPLLGMLIRLNVFQDNESKKHPFKIYEDTYIDGIPIKKWVCVVIRLTSQNILDIYINGTLTKRHKLTNLVKQNYDDVYINYKNGGFRGNLSNLRYYNYAIGTYEIDKITSQGPNLNMAEDSNIKKSAPQYLSYQWYFNDSDTITSDIGL